MGNEASKPSTAHTHGGGVSSASDAKSFATVDVELRRKFGQGLTYNMKVVIRGDRNTGKTNLFRRLQQQDFTEEYIPTKEIQVGTIHWNYKVTDDVVKVEVWDVVDSANNRITSASVASSLRKGDESDDITISQVRESASPGRYQLHALDANTVDVYKGCHAVLMVVDPTKKWTFEYAQEHIPLIPEDIEVAIIANSRDLYTRWAVSSEEMRTYVDSLERRIHFFETSMVDGFGISSITSFLNIPFLKIQRHVFVQKLEKNKEELDSAFAEVALMSKEQNYAFYLKWLEQKKESKLRKPSVSPASRSGSVISMPSQTDSSDSPHVDTATLSRPSIEVSKSSSVQKQDQSPSVSSSPEKPKASIDLTKPQQSTPTAEVSQSKVDEPSPQQLAKDHEPVNTAPTDTTLAVQDQKEKQQQSAKPNQVHETQEQVARALSKPADPPAAATKNDLPPSQIAVPLATKSSSQTPTTTTATTPIPTPTPTPTPQAPESTPQQEKPKDEPKLVVKKEGISLDTFDTGELDENFFSSEDDGEEDVAQQPQKTVAIEEKMPPIISEAEMQRAELSEFKASSKKDEKKSKEKKSKKADENLGIVEEKPKKKKTKEANQDTSTHAEDEVQEKKKEKDKTKTKTKTGDKKKSKEVLLESVEKSGAYADFASLSGDEQHTTKAKKEKKSAKLPRGYEDFSEIAEPALETLESTASAVVEKKKKKKSKEAVDVDESTPQLQVDEGEKAKKKKKAKDEATVESKTEKKEKRTKKNADPVMGETSEKSKVKGKKKAQVQETIADSGDELDDFYADVE